jgi:hypothetical protein
VAADEFRDRPCSDNVKAEALRDKIEKMRAKGKAEELKQTQVQTDAALIKRCPAAAQH